MSPKKRGTSMDWKLIFEKLDKKVDAMTDHIGQKSPHAATGLQYDDMPVDWWTSGFWPGILWIMYDMTGKEKYKNAAWDWDQRLADFLLYGEDFHHDVGFQFLPTAVIKYKITQDKKAFQRGIAAANYLAGRFNLKGNFIRAWNWEANMGKAIIDCCMNISLLFWAASVLPDPRYAHIAKTHADMVVKYFLRDDGSVRHIVEFDAETGEYKQTHGGQGYGPDSAWSRGQAWAIYGLANCYKYTGDEKYLNAAKRVAHYFMASLPDDFVPYWDFRLPSFEGEPRDTSAASCAASGLIEIAKNLPKEQSWLYIEGAKKILSSLTNNYSKIDDLEHEAILFSATGNKPGNSNVNVSLIYGDYYYVEAVAKLAGWEKNIF
jgi:unsaturated chondroitin disaccharide hydrolase